MRHKKVTYIKMNNWLSYQYIIKRRCEVEVVVLDKA